MLHITEFHRARPECGVRVLDATATFDSHLREPHEEAASKQPAPFSFQMSHLYELFSKQVARFCADSSRPDCNKNLLISGVRSLAGMDDNVLDKLDPYQRGAKDMSKKAFLRDPKA